MHLLPAPKSIVASGGRPFIPDVDLAINGSPEQAAIIRRLLSPGTGLDLPVSADGRLIIVDDPALAPEAYRLEVTTDRIMITASGPAGVNWAGQTLRQLLPPSALRPAPDGRPLSVPAVMITDEPRFGWRGIHLDVARHFMPLPELFQLVDLLALHKFNRLHLHLSDDQGWRFESRSPSRGCTRSADGGPRPGGPRMIMATVRRTAATTPKINCAAWSGTPGSAGY